MTWTTHDNIRCSALPCEKCAMTEQIVEYMMAAMDPTDRALRLPGDVYPVRKTADGMHPAEVPS